LQSLIGRPARELKLRAHGHGSAVIRTGGLPKSVSRETTLAQDATQPERLEGLLALFAARVGAELRAEGLVARTVTLKLRHADFHTVTRSVTLSAPTNLDAELLEPMVRLFRTAFGEACRRRQGVRLIGLATTNLVRQEPPDLFEPERRTRLRALTQAVDEVRQKFGFDALTPARLLESPTPP
jgi:DNA polymerase-4